MKKVRDGLYLGSLDDALPLLTGSRTGNITHVLSVASLRLLSDDKSLQAVVQFRNREAARLAELQVVQQAGNAISAPQQSEVEDVAASGLVARKVVPLMDTENQNLLDHLEESLEFIEEGIGKGNVLVHCVAGISRSASVVTAYLMKKEKLSLAAALEELKKCKNDVSPNYGFMQQLKMFEQMGCVVDKSSPHYKQFRVRGLGLAHKNGQSIPLSDHAADPAENAVSGSGGTIFRCKKCRRMLATEQNVLVHSPGAQARPVKWKKRDLAELEEQAEAETCTASIFVEPMQWMKLTVHTAGKLHCLGCAARLGSYNWSGVHCHCGTVVVPAFQLHASRVDVSPS